MTNREALEQVRAVLNAFTEKVQLDDEAFEQELRNVLFDWSLVPQLEGIGEVLAKAWLEAKPTSARARGALVEHLTGIGKAQDALAIQDGASAPEIGTASDDEINRTKENLLKSGRALGLVDPKSK